MIYGILLFLIVLLAIDLIVNKNLVTPGVLFNGIFFVTLLLYNFYLSNIQQVLSIKLLLTLLGCIICFNVPVFISYYLKTKKKSNTVQEKPVQLTMSRKKELIIFLIWIIVFVIEIIYNKGFPLLWKIIDSNKTYVDFGFPLLNGVFLSLTSIMGSYSLFKKGCWYKWFYLATGLLIINRNLIITIFLQGFVFFLLTHPGWFKKKRNILLSVVGVVLIIVEFSLIGNFRTGEQEFLRVAEFKSSANWLPTSFKWVYSYMCFSLSNLNNLFAVSGGGIYHGLLVVKSIAPNLIADQIYVGNYPNFLIKEEFNVSTFAPDLYLDFGIAGVVIFCLLLGLLCSFIYKKASNNEFFKLAYSVLAYCIVFIFFVNMLLMPTAYFQFILIPILFCNYENVKLKFKKIFKRS